jgi:hypothetical protein
MISNDDLKMIEDEAEPGSDTALLLDEVKQLKQKIGETEERLAQRVLAALDALVIDLSNNNDEIDPKVTGGFMGDPGGSVELLEKIYNKFESMYNFDLFEIQQKVAKVANMRADRLNVLRQTVIRFKGAHEELESMESEIDIHSDPLEERRKMVETKQELFVSREKMFSLLSEISLKEKFEDQI